MNAEAALEYIKKFAEAAMPAAQRAYEIGLITLRVDAAASLLPAIAVLVALWFAWPRVVRAFADAKDYADKANRGEKGYIKEWSSTKDSASDHLNWIWYLAAFAASVATFFAAIQVLSVWAWVKLFAPELWLAHHMVERALEIGK